jgi:hypothetical protein
MSQPTSGQMLTSNDACWTREMVMSAPTPQLEDDAPREVSVQLH